MSMSRSQARVVDPVLSQVALDYKDPEFVGSTLFPEINNVPSGAKVIRFDKKSFLKYNLRRSPGAETPDIQFGYASDTISLVQDALNGKVPREWMRDSMLVPNINHGTRAIRSVMKVIRRQLEIEQAELAQDANNYDADHKISLGTAWTAAAADAKGDIDTGMAAVRASVGVEANVLVIPYTAYKGLQKNTAIKEQFKYTSSKSITTDMMAEFFGLDKVVVGKAIFATDESSDFSDIWSKAVLAYVPPSPESVEEPSFGYTYIGDGQPLVEEAYFNKGKKSWIYPVEYERRPYITAMKSGYLIDGVQ